MPDLPSDTPSQPGGSAPPAASPATVTTTGERLRSLDTLLTPVNPRDPTWRWVIGWMSDPRVPLAWLVGIGGVCALGLLFIRLQGDAIDFYPILAALRAVLSVVVVLALIALAAFGWLAYRLRMAAADRHEAANALFMQAQTAPIATRADLLDGALARWREALEVCPRTLGPGAWATTQLCLARAAAQRAQLDAPEAAGGAANPLLQEAVTGYHVALRAQAPQLDATQGSAQLWLATQRDLAATLRLQAERAPASERAHLYQAATAPYRNILAAQMPAVGPRVWADTQIELAGTLAEAAQWAAPSDDVRLLREAAAAYQAASEVYLHSANEREWAGVRRAYGDTLRRAAARAGDAERAPLLDGALAAYAQAQSVFTRWVSQGDWAALQLVSGQTLRERAALEMDQQQRPEWLRRAVNTLDGALEIFTLNEQPEAWAAAQQALGEALSDLAVLRLEPERQQLLQEATTALAAAQSTYTDLGAPQQADQARAALERARAALARTEQP